MNRGTLGEDIRVLAVAAEPEAEAAQQASVSVWRVRIAIARREARQQPGRLGKAAGLGDPPCLIRRGIGAANASARGKARARLGRKTGDRLQGVHDGCWRGAAAGELVQYGTLGSNDGARLCAGQVEFSSPKPSCLVRFCDKSRNSLDL